MSRLSSDWADLLSCSSSACLRYFRWPALLRYVLASSLMAYHRSTSPLHLPRRGKILKLLLLQTRSDRAVESPWKVSHYVQLTAESRSRSCASCSARPRKASSKAVPLTLSAAFESYPDGGYAAWLQVACGFAIIATTNGGVYSCGDLRSAARNSALNFVHSRRGNPSRRFIRARSSAE